MRDSFTCERDAFVAAWDRLGMADKKSFADFPAAEDVRPLKRQAQFLADQFNNPLRDFNLTDLWGIELASSFLRWAEDPGNPARWQEMFNARVEIDRHDR
jgi:hypothetical protein